MTRENRRSTRRSSGMGCSFFDSSHEFHGFFAGKIIQYVRRHLLICLALFNRAQCRFLPMLFLPLHQNREYNLDGDFCYGFSVITLIFTVICP